jgi:hypothetical protein
MSSLACLSVLSMVERGLLGAFLLALALLVAGLFEWKKPDWGPADESPVDDAEPSQKR